MLPCGLPFRQACSNALTGLCKVPSLCTFLLRLESLEGILLQRKGKHQNPFGRSRRRSDCKAWCDEESKESFAEYRKRLKSKSRVPKAFKTKIPRLPIHIKIHKSVAALALAGCPQTIIERGLGITQYRKFFKQIGNFLKNRLKHAKRCVFPHRSL